MPRKLNTPAPENSLPVWNKVAWSAGPIGSGYRYSITLEQSGTDTTPVNSMVPAFLKAVDGFSQQLNNKKD